MKSIAATILLIALLAQFGNRYLIMVNYEMNKSFIAATLCENRSKPMSGCNGKCFLKKQLDKSAKEQNTPASNNKNDQNEMLFIQGQKKLITHFFFWENSAKYLSVKQSFTPQILYGSVFHPPQIV